MLNTVKKIGPVLDLFTAERPEWRMTDIAKALQMPKSSAHSLVSTLADVGLLTSSGPNGRYRLGWNLLNLSERMRASLELTKHALPPMTALAANTCETVYLAALDGQEVVYIERVEGAHPVVRLAGASVGTRAPAHSTAAGKVLLAFRESNELDAILRDLPLDALTPRTIATTDDLMTTLVKTRARGVAFDRGETVPDVACVSAPVFDRCGCVLAAMSVSMPAYRFPQRFKSIIAPLKANAAEVSKSIAAADSDTDEQALEAMLAGMNA